MVDTRDLKSLVGSNVPVRVRSPAPRIPNATAFGIFTYYSFPLLSLAMFSVFLESKKE